MLNQLILTNFQKHAHLTHTFKPGLTLVTGANWAGKTTILRAVLYALFGTSAVNVKAGNLVSRSNTGMEVVLDFQVGGQSYLVIRGPKKAELYQGIALVASGQTPVTAMIESLIGDAKSFLPFQTARQGEASGLLTLGAAKLAQHIDTVTGVDTVDQVLERAKTARDALAAVPGLLAEAESEHQEHRTRLETLEQELAPLQAEISVHQKSLVVAQQAATAVQQAWSTATHGLTAYQAYVRELGEFTRRRDDAEADLRLARRDLEQCPEQDVDAIYQRLAWLQEAAQAHALQLQAWQTWQTQHDALERGVAALLPQTASVPLPELAEAKVAAETALHDWQAALDALSQAQVSLTSATCHACGRPFEDHDVGKAEARLAAAQLHVELLQPAVDAARTRYNNLRHTQAVQDSLQLHITALQTQQRALVRPPEPGPALDSAELEAAQSQYQAAVQGQARRAQALKELQDAEATQRQAEGWLASVVAVPEVRQEQVDQALRDYHAAYQAYQTVDQLAGNLRMREYALQQEQASAQTAVDRAAARLGPLQQQAQRSERLTQLMKYLRGSRERFTTQAWANLLAYASTFVQDASGGALTELRRTPGGEFTYVEDGEELPLELASGQQLAILGVAAKLALAAAVGSSFEVLLLDEVSAAASDDNALQLATCLARTGQQILLVSHRDADAAVAADVISLGL